MLAKQRIVGGLWGLVSVLTVESAFIVRQQGAGQGDESKVKPEQPLVLGLKSSEEDKAGAGSWEGDRGVNLSQGQVGDQQGIESGSGKGTGTYLCRGGWEQPRRIQTQFQEARGRRGCYQP